MAGRASLEAVATGALQGSGGVIATEIDGYRLLIRAPAQAGGRWAYTVLRRQYGKDSLFALVGLGSEGDLVAAVRARERLSRRIAPTLRGLELHPENL